MRLTKSAFTVATSTGSSVAVDLGSEMPTEMIQGLGTLAGVVITHKHRDHLHIDHLRLIDAPNSTRAFTPTPQWTSAAH